MKVNWKAVLWFVVGVLVGMWMTNLDCVRDDPTPEQCLSVCVEEFEKYGC